MLEINDLDQSRPSDARTPDKVASRGQVEIPSELLAQAVAAGASSGLPRQTPMLTPIETPLTFSGFNDNVLREFGPLFQQLGVAAAQGGAGSAIYATKPADGWKDSLQPGGVVAGVLVSGDMSVTGLGTVTYNDGKRVLAFGHPFFNLGPVNMPMSRGEVLMVLSSAFQPNKIANATEIVGELTQDRHSGILGVLGQQSAMIPVSVNVDLLPERRVASIENAWVPSNEVHPGEDVPVKVFLRPYRGERIEREFQVHVPAGLAKGDHRILLSDAETANRMQNMAGSANRYIDLPQTVSLINQERSNNKLYVSLLQSSPTAYYDDKTMPSLPASVLNVMQTGRAASRAVLTTPESATQQTAIPFDYVVSGSYSLKITVK